MKKLFSIFLALLSSSLFLGTCLFSHEDEGNHDFRPFPGHIFPGIHHQSPSRIKRCWIKQNYDLRAVGPRGRFGPPGMRGPQGLQGPAGPSGEPIREFQFHPLDGKMHMCFSMPYWFAGEDSYRLVVICPDGSRFEQDCGNQNSVDILLEAPYVMKGIYSFSFINMGPNDFSFYSWFGFVMRYLRFSCAWDFPVEPMTEKFIKEVTMDAPNPWQAGQKVEFYYRLTDTLLP